MLHQMPHRKNTLLTFLLCFFAAPLLFAQTGSIKGNVKDLKTSEALIGATVSIQGTTSGAITDVEGNFLLPKVAVGKQVIVMSYVSYKAKSLEVDVESGKQIVISTAMEEDAGTELQEVVVTASRATNTEVAVISEIKQAQQIAVGISAQQIVKSQDRDAAQIVRRVPGVSIIDNRFIIVRGLAQRYNSVMLNDVLTPSSEVDIKSFAFDLIPYNMIDRMIIYKSGAAELPGEFAGGVVKIYTKRAPEENFTNVSLTTGYRFGTTGKEVQTYEGSRTDFLGFDNQSRQLPNTFPVFLGSAVAPPQRAALANQLNNTWQTQSKSVSPDFRFSFDLGRRFNIGNISVGNMTAINYSNVHQYLLNNLNTYEGFNATTQSSPTATSYQDDQYRKTSRLGVLHNWSFRFNSKNSIEFKNLFNQLGFSETVLREGKNFPNGVDEKNYSLRYEQRSIYMGQLVGNHGFSLSEKSKSNLNWQLGFAYTNRKEPDWKRWVTNRPTGATGSDGRPAAYSLAIPSTPTLFDASRYFSNLKETVLTASVNSEHNWGPSEEKQYKLKAGIYVERKDRNFAARNFSYVPTPGSGDIAALKTLPVNEVFGSQNVTGTPNKLTFDEDGNGLTINKYEANNTLLAGYAGLSIPFTDKFNGVAGVRVEYNDQFVRSVPRPRGGEAIVTLLPSLNLTYNLSDKSLFRVAYSRTVNRPEFRELAPFNFYDFNINANIQGNPTLGIAKIHNVDARYEYYPSVSELISFGVFYKYFQNPIESYLLIGSGGASSLNYSYGNALNARGYGAEIEIRKGFEEIISSGFLKNISVVANASYMFSQVENGQFVNLGADAGGLVDIGKIQGKSRPMVSQSPYLINTGLYYNDEDKGLQVNLLYNVYGARIFAVGNINSPTIWEKPRNLIDFNIAKVFKKRFEIRLTVQDILNQQFRLAQDSNQDVKSNDVDENVRTYRPGSYTMLGVTYRF